MSTSTQAPRFSAWMYNLVLGLFLGSTLVMSRFVLSEFEPLTYNAIRLTLGGSILYLILRTRGRVLRPIADLDAWPLHTFMVGGIGTAVPFSFFVLSMRYQSSGLTSVFITLTPIAAMMMAHRFLKDEPITRRQIVGTLIALGGVVLLAVFSENGLGPETQWAWQGLVLVILGVLGNAAGIVYTRSKLQHVPTSSVSIMRTWGGAVVLLLLAAVVEPSALITLPRISTAVVAATVYGACAGVTIGMTMYAFIAQRFGAGQAARTEYVVTIAATSLGALILGERVSIIMLLGMGLILFGVGLSSNKRPAVVDAD